MQGTLPSVTPTEQFDSQYDRLGHKKKKKNCGTGHPKNCLNIIMIKNYLNVAVVAGILLENVNTMRPKRKKRKGISELHSGIQPVPSMPLLSGTGKQLQFR